MAFLWIAGVLFSALALLCLLPRPVKPPPPERRHGATGLEQRGLGNGPGGLSVGDPRDAGEGGDGGGGDRAGKRGMA